MGLFFLRYLVLTWYLVGVCYSLLPNLVPLKGVLHDFESSRNVTVEEEILDIFDGMITKRPFPSAPAGAGVASAGASAGGQAGVSGGGAFGPPVQASMEGSFQEGAAASRQQQQVQNANPAAADLELSSRFHAAFRRASRVAEAASCVGRALIETTRDLVQRLNLSVSQAATQLFSMEVDQAMCEDILQREGCEDFRRPAPCNGNDPYRRIDGSCNNLANPTWGRSMTRFVRYIFPAYENGIDSMRGEGREGANRLPSARTVSYNLQRIQPNPPFFNITLMVMQWGQFTDHDITFTAETQISRVKSRTETTLRSPLVRSEGGQFACPSDSVEDPDTVPLECCPNGIPVDDGDLIDCRPIDVSDDPFYSSNGRRCMRFVRSLIASKGCELGPREQLDELTAYIDGSQVYGSTDEVANLLRERSGGRLLQTEEGDLLPRTCCEDLTFNCFRGGDTRVNEQPALTSMHTLWLRIHQNLVSDLAIENPHWNDETLYQEARRIVGALLQQVTYREFLPVILGPETIQEEDLGLLPEGSGATYDPSVDPSIANVIATAAFRFGHSLVNNMLRGSGEFVSLLGNFENAKVIFRDNTRPTALLEGLVTSPSLAPDHSIDFILSNFLFANVTDKVGFDLMALNTQRGRDHGLPPYTTWRAACRLPTFTSFEELSTAMPRAVAEAFSRIYSNVNEIDLFPAALSEFPIDGGVVGPTFACLIGQQFSSLKKGDRFFFQNSMQPNPFRNDQLNSISKITLASLMCQHLDIKYLQSNVFRPAGDWNGIYPCSSYPTLDTSLWKENKQPYYHTSPQVRPAIGCRLYELPTPSQGYLPPGYSCIPLAGRG